MGPFLESPPDRENAERERCSRCLRKSLASPHSEGTHAASSRRSNRNNHRGRHAVDDLSPRRLGTDRRDPHHRRRAGRRRDRPVCPNDRRAYVEDAPAADHRREQARRERQSRRAIHRRSARRRQHPLAWHAGVHRNPAERVHPLALVHRPVPSDHPRRRGAAGVHRPSERAGQDLRRVLGMGKAEQGASSATRRTRPERRRTSSAISSTRSSIST